MQMCSPEPITRFCFKDFFNWNFILFSSCHLISTHDKGRDLNTALGVWCGFTVYKSIVTDSIAPGFQFISVVPHLLAWSIVVWICLIAWNLLSLQTIYMYRPKLSNGLLE